MNVSSLQAGLKNSRIIPVIGPTPVPTRAPGACVGPGVNPGAGIVQAGLTSSILARVRLDVGDSLNIEFNN